MSPKQKANAIKSDWREYVLGPSGPLVEPVRVAVVPWDAKELKPSSIKWRRPRDMESLPVEEGQGLLLDFGVKTAGFVYLESESGTDFGLDVQFGPDIRLVIFEDKIKYSSGAGCFCDEKFRAFRYLKVRSCGGAGLTARIRVQFTGWRGDYKGHFYCSDDVLNRIWYTGAYTIQLCTQPHELSGTYNHLLPAKYGDFPKNWRSPHGQYVIWDGPRRDREVWIGDIWPESHGLLHSFHAPEAIKSSLLAVSVRQTPSGQIPGSGITLQAFAEYSCWWLALLDHYHLMTDDRAFLREVESNIKRAVDWLLGELASNNGYLHINHRQTWAWTLMRRGTVTGSQCVAVAALEGGARVLGLLGDKTRATKALKAAKRLRGQVAKELWKEKEGVFRDCLNPPDGVERVSCDSNALASLFGVASEGQSQRSMAYLQKHLWTPFGTRTIVPPEPEENWNWAHNHNVWPFVVGLELEARFERGHRSSGLELMRACWGNMIAKGATAFWEMVGGEDGDFVTHRRVADVQGPSWDSWDSYSHGWSAAPTTVLPRYVLGVRPLQPGFARFRVEPWLGDLEFAEGQVPTPHGPIAIRVERVARKGAQVLLEVPQGTVAEVVTSGGKLMECRAGYHELQTER
jgi:hypothetical protein